MCGVWNLWRPSLSISALPVARPSSASPSVSAQQVADRIYQPPSHICLIRFYDLRTLEKLQEHICAVGRDEELRVIFFSLNFWSLDVRTLQRYCRAMAKTSYVLSLVDLLLTISVVIGRTKTIRLMCSPYQSTKRN